MLWSWKNNSGCKGAIDVSHVQVIKVEEIDERWWPKRYAVNAVTAPKRLAKRVITKPYRVYSTYRKKQEEDDHLTNIYARIKLLKKCCDSLPLSYLLQNNFNERLLWVCKGGFNIMLTATPPGLRKTLRVDSFGSFCSSYIIPILSLTQDWVHNNKDELAPYSEDALPVLRRIGKQSAILSQIIWSKSQGIVFLSFSKVKPLLHDILYNPKTREHLCDFVVQFQNNLKIVTESIYVYLPREHLWYIMDNRWVILNQLLRMSKIIFKVIIKVLPMSYHGLVFAAGTTTKFYAILYNEILLFIDSNPIIKECFKEMCTEFYIIVKVLFTQLIDSSPLVYATAHDFMCVLLKMLNILYPLIRKFILTNSGLFLTVLKDSTTFLLPFLIVMISNIFSVETQNFIDSNLPRILAIISRMYVIVEMFLRIYFSYNIFICSRIFEMEPIVSACLKMFFLTLCQVSSAMVIGILSALREITPAIYKALHGNIHIIKLGVCLILQDLTEAVRVVSPTMYSAVRIILQDICTAYLEVYPDIVAAVLVVCPEIVAGVRTIMPVLFSASVEVMRDFYLAFCIMAPTIQNSAYIMTSATWTAARISSPVILTASCNVSTTMKFAVKELCRTFNVACLEISSKSLKGAFVVTRDIIHAYHTLYRDRQKKKGKSFATGARFIASNVLIEVKSLMWIAFCIEICEEKNEINDRNHQSELSPMKKSKIQLRELIKTEAEPTYKQLSSQSTYENKKLLDISTSTVLFEESTRNYNCIPLSTITNINRKVIKCYEKVEPHVAKSLVSTQLYIKSVLKSDYVKNYTELKYLDLLYCWQQTLVSSTKIVSHLPTNYFYLQHVTRTLCLINFQLFSKSSSIAWNVFLLVSPAYWSFIKSAAPEIWSMICNVSPFLWVATCATTRNAWISVRRLSPEIWQRSGFVTKSLWNMLNSRMPEMWRLVRHTSPYIWSLTCKIVSKIWNHICALSPVVWNNLCQNAPFLWKLLSTLTAKSWMEYCQIISKSWSFYCSSADYCWNVNRSIVVIIWYTLLCDDCFFNQLFPDSSEVVEKVLRLSGNAWSVFCAFVGLCVIVRQCDSLTDLLMGPAFMESEISEDFLILKHLSSQVGQRTQQIRLQTKATRTFSIVLRDIMSIKSLLSSTESAMKRYFKLATVDTVADAQIFCKNVMRKTFSNNVKKTLHAFYYQR